MFLSFLANEIEIVKIFYYRDPYTHISITLSLYIFESCLEFTLNCFLCSDDVVSQKYHNNGNLDFITSLSLSFISNIITGVVVWIIKKLTNYYEFLQILVKEVKKERHFIRLFNEVYKCLKKR